MSKKEGNSGTTSFVVTLTLSERAIDPVTLSYTTVSVTAKSTKDVKSGADFVATSGKLTIPVGSSSKTITVPVLGDKLKEPNEKFFLSLSNASDNAYFGDSLAVATIQNDD